MEFYTISQKEVNKYKSNVYADFKVRPSSDFMTQGHAFYAVWNENTGLWSQNEFDVAKIVDEAVEEYVNKKKGTSNLVLEPLYMHDFGSSAWSRYKKFLKEAPDNFKQLDTKIAFSNTEVKKSDYISRKLPYAMEEGSIEAYDEIMSTIYDPEQREKIEWAIGAIISGDSKKIQKFIGLYGGPGTGKSTILNIIEAMFDGYCVTFDAKELVSGTNAFAGDAFAKNPLIGIQHDGDLSKVNDNSLLNTIVSHEKLTINEKYKSKFSVKLNTFLFMATNEPFKITNLNSGLSRRLIDVHPSGRLIDTSKYYALMDKVMTEELGHIAYHCLKVYEERGKSYYSTYKPVEMMYRTDPFFNFVQDYIMMSPEIMQTNSISLAAAYNLYKQYKIEEEVPFSMQKYKFRDNLKDYFEKFMEGQHRNDKGEKVYSVFYGFKFNLFDVELNTKPKKKDVEEYDWLDIKEQESIFDNYCADELAQYTYGDNEKPLGKWDDVKTTLKEIDTSKVHYVKVPVNHIVIDFDLKDESGNKSLELNLEAAREFPPTYAEVSKGGNGLHLHYLYSGDPTELSRIYDENIEVKVFNGGSSLRRRLSLCNNLPIATMADGFLPKKENKKVINFDTVKNEKSIRTLVKNNLNKEYHPGTKPSIDFIKKILDDAYDSGVVYDISDMENDIINFALNSSHQSEYCLEQVAEMHFKSEELAPEPELRVLAPIVFYDVEVFPNLFIVNYKFEGADNPVIRLINPGPSEMEMLMKYRLIGFNCRRYDNHIIYARYQGYTNEELYNLSQRIINKVGNPFIGAAWNLSYTDIYDYASKKQSLKKWEIELGIHHQELGLPWDQPVDKKLWEKVAEYCDNDVIATEAVWNATQGDFLAREILAELTGLTVNDTTNTLSTKFIFGDNKHPQDEFNYRFMGEPEYGHTCHMEDDGITCVQDDGKIIFPGYKFELGKSSYLDVDEVGEGGYVYSRPGMYTNVWTFDVASMHPSSVIAEELFGPEFTKRFKDILQLRLNIKHKDFDKAKKMFGGALAKYLDDPKKAKALAQALKIVINSVYGLTAASFENPFRDARNIDNIVAKRGALFMINLRNLVEKMGYTVVHVKTDSIKIANPDKKIYDFVMNYGKRFGYNFEIEHKFEKICLVNDAVYIAKLSEDDEEWLEDTSKTRWTATGTQFAVPYVFKTLFSHEEVTFADICETKQVGKGDLYLDMNEALPDVSEFEKLKAVREKLVKKVGTWNAYEDCAVKLTKAECSLLEAYKDLTDQELNENIAEGHCYQFIGRVGSFVPIKEGCGGGNLYRFADDKYYTATGAKGYRWLEAETVQKLNKEDCIDMGYHNGLVNDAIETISQYGDFEWFAE